jgi:hypothetical protein
MEDAPLNDLMESQDLKSIFSLKETWVGSCLLLPKAFKIDVDPEK